MWDTLQLYTKGGKLVRLTGHINISLRGLVSVSTAIFVYVPRRSRSYTRLRDSASSRRTPWRTSSKSSFVCGAGGRDSKQISRRPTGWWLEIWSWLSLYCPCSTTRARTQAHSTAALSFFLWPSYSMHFPLFSRLWRCMLNGPSRKAAPLCLLSPVGRIICFCPGWFAYEDH